MGDFIVLAFDKHDKPKFYLSPFFYATVRHFIIKWKLADLINVSNITNSVGVKFSGLA